MVDGVIMADAVPRPDAPDDDPVPVVGAVVKTTGTVTVGGGAGVVLVVVLAGAVGVTAVDALDAVPVPAELVAVTVNV
jgi:hypothetical protein